jgi:hypothetical protein
LAIPATTAHRQSLHLPLVTVFPSRSPCSPRPAVVMPLAAIIARRSSGRVHRRELLRGLLPSAPPLLFPVRAFCSPCSREALAPHRGWSWQPAGEQSRHSAIPAGELPPEFPCLWELVRRMRLSTGSTLVPSPSPEISPAASLPPVSGNAGSAHRRVGPVSALGPCVSCSGQAWVHGIGCTQRL